MDNRLACRATHPRRFPDIAKSGLRFVEIVVPKRENLSVMRSQLLEHNLQPTSVTVPMDVRSDDGIAHLDDAFDIVNQLEAKIVFTSVKSEGADREDVYTRLRKVGDIAREHGLTVSLETHPDLATNGLVAHQTMERVGHPNIRINFDPANIYYYNEGADAVAELINVLPYVASFHLKETTGGYRSNDFPAIGHGVVDFKRIFTLLYEEGYKGPFTFEIEGHRLQGDDRDTAFRTILLQSLDYLDTLELGPKASSYKRHDR